MASKRKQRLARLRRNHFKNCAVFNNLPCSCREAKSEEESRFFRAEEDWRKREQQRKAQNHRRREPAQRCCNPGCNKGIWPSKIAYRVSHHRTDLLACSVHCQRKWLSLHPKTVYEPAPYAQKKSRQEPN
jgi:hypothetical protein